MAGGPCAEGFSPLLLSHALMKPTISPMLGLNQDPDIKSSICSPLHAPFNRRCRPHASTMSRDNDQLSKSGALEGRQKPEHWLQMMEWSKQPENWSRPTTAFSPSSRPTTACTGINRPAIAWTTDTLREHNDSSVTLVPLVPGRDVEHSQKMPYFNEQTKYLTRRRVIMVLNQSASCGNGISRALRCSLAAR